MCIPNSAFACLGYIISALVCVLVNKLKTKVKYEGLLRISIMADIIEVVFRFVIPTDRIWN